MAALIYALIRKLSGSGFLYLKLLGVDVYADFDEDSDSDLRLEIGAHLDLVFEG